MSSGPQIVWQARDDEVTRLVQECAEGRLPFSGPNSLATACSERGWSFRGMYEAVRAAEDAIKSSKIKPEKSNEESSS